MSPTSRTRARARRRRSARTRRCRAISRPISRCSLAADANALAPGGERREIATLFTDIAGFTPLVKSLDPRELASLLSGYLEGMTEIVFAHEGTVAKIIGDAIHVLFGAPPNSPTRRNGRSPARSRSTHARGIPPRMEERGARSARPASAFMRDRRSSAISAAGGCSTTRPTATPSTPRRGSRRSTSSSAPAFASARAAERARVHRPPGRRSQAARPERAAAGLRAAGGGRRGSPAAKTYADAFAKLEARDPAAVAAFAALVGLSPADPLAQYHLKRLLNGAWNGDRDALWMSSRESGIQTPAGGGLDSRSAGMTVEVRGSEITLKP